MKFLVLALCVCAASAASLFGQQPFQAQAAAKTFGQQPFPAQAVVKTFGQQPFQAQTFGQQPFQPQAAAKAFVQTVSVPAALVAPAVYAAEKVITQTPVVAQTPVAAVRNVYIDAKDTQATVLRADSEVSRDGYNYYYETSNGIAAQASGITKKVGNDDVVAVQGSYKYVDNDGKNVQLTYIADENGYQPQSELLPVGPPIPDYILRALEYIRLNYKPESN